MSRARRIGKVWFRGVPRSWKQRGGWRTDIHKTVLADPTLSHCCFSLEGGPIVVIPVVEVRRVIEGGRERYGGKIWGPFNIDHAAQTIDGQTVTMVVRIPQIRFP
jgi:hypothetical protein